MLIGVCVTLLDLVCDASWQNEVWVEIQAGKMRKLIQQAICQNAAQLSGKYSRFCLNRKKTVKIKVFQVYKNMQ